MALTVDQQQPNLKYFCKICKKGFGCGRALGGHMRAHGIGDDSWNLDDDEDAASDWDGKTATGGNDRPSTKRFYALRTNPNRSKSCRVCENCGKEFSSWDSFLEHGKCTSSNDRHVVQSSPVSSQMSDDDGEGDGERGCGWSKRKRSFRAKVGTLNSSSEDVDIAANCLVMLSNAKFDPRNSATEESSASPSREEERRSPMNYIPPISYCVPAVVDHKAKSAVTSKGLFECKACKKTFNSHQALGGHRASHKKVKGCFASRLDNVEDKDHDDVLNHEEFLPTKSSSISHHPSSSNASLFMVSSSKRKSKVHECSICHRTFSSGQALGGHKRCHWITPNVPDSSTFARFQQFQDHIERMNQIPKFDNSEPLDLKLDLNLPAAPENSQARRNLATEIFLQPWLGGTMEKDKSRNNNNTNSQCHSPSNRELQHNGTEKDNKDGDKNNKKNSTIMSMENVEDEADSKVKKLAKLSELKDMNIGGSSSPWLQVGIGSTTGVGAEP